MNQMAETRIPTTRDSVACTHVGGVRLGGRAGVGRAGRLSGWLRPRWLQARRRRPTAVCQQGRR